jgi:hypothetical protein
MFRKKPRYRFTIESPPVDLLSTIPNWEYALDEEGRSDQDETTLRPAESQASISTDVVFTSGVLDLADGSQCTALLEIMDGRIKGITASENGVWTWTVRLLGHPPRWQSIDYSWLPEPERPHVVSLSNSVIFPLTAKSVLPSAEGGANLTTRIERGIVGVA